MQNNGEKTTDAQEMEILIKDYLVQLHGKRFQNLVNWVIL